MGSPFESISPLTDDIRQCLIAMLSVGMVSLLSTTLLLVHITYNLVRWKLRDMRLEREERKQAALPTPAPRVDLSLGLTEEQYYQTRRGGRPHAGSEPPPFEYLASSQQQQELSLDTNNNKTTLSHGGDSSGPAEADTAAGPTTTRPSAATRSRSRREKPPNPLLLLIYNLLLGDVALSAAYTNAIVWLAQDGIVAPSRTCSAQGWIISFGCLATSGFLCTISIFSYLGIIRGYKATQRDVLIACTTVWTMSIVAASVGPLYYHGDGTFYGRETNWCWISEKHKLWRLSVYLWGLPTMSVAGGVYGVIFYKLWKEGRSSRYMPRRRGASTSSSLADVSAADRASTSTETALGVPPTTSNNHNNSSNNNSESSSSSSSRRDAISSTTPLRPSGHHPAFLIYPCIYMVTGTPLMLGSLMPALERSPAFMGAAGGVLAATGLLDTLLWSSIVLFSRREDLRNTGLDRFAFMRTPEGRTLGNIVFVQGGGGESGGGGGGGGGSSSSKSAGVSYHHHHRQSWHSRKKEKGWWPLGDKRDDQEPLSGEMQSQHHEGIQMQVVTSVVIERDSPHSGHSREFSREAKSLETL